MTGSTALDVVIGLIFIYLLYSLFATVIAELFATHAGLRARNLNEAIDRMLNDEIPESRWERFKQFFSLIPAIRTDPTVKKFYDHQEVKYLGRISTRKPSAIRAINFAKVVLDFIKKEGTGSGIQQVRTGLEKLGSDDKIEGPILGKYTALYVLSMLDDCQNDLDKFKTQLEVWFDRTMEQTTEWYKRRIQVILFGIGFFLAWGFNACTFEIVKKLSTDEDARDKMVQLASAYVENNNVESNNKDKTKFLTFDPKDASQDSLTVANYNELLIDYNERLDTLLSIKKELNKDIANANSLLGLGSWLPDNLEVKKGQVIFPSWVEIPLAKKSICGIWRDRKVEIKFGEKIHYLMLLLLGHFWGYVTTALAISLGAPFWFDMLSKLMKIRGVVKGSPSAAASAEQKGFDQKIIKG